MSDNHEVVTVDRGVHKRVSDTTEGGACISGRCHASYDLHTCSYRYQGIEAAKGHLDTVYNHPDIPEIFHVGDDKKTSRAAVIGALSKEGVRRDIAVNGRYTLRDDKQEFPKAPFRRKDGEVYERYKDDKELYMREHWFVNFTVGKVPWTNQVHHVLNQSSLNTIIDTFHNIKPLVQQGLFEELYNINHKDNMVILPTGVDDSRLTGLPMHGSHPSYNDEIIEAVTKAMKGYEKLNADAENGAHAPTDSIAVRDKLLKISSKWYKKIINLVPKNKDMSNPLIKVNDIE